MKQVSRNTTHLILNYLLAVSCRCKLHFHFVVTDKGVSYQSVSFIDDIDITVIQRTILFWIST